MFNDKGEFEKSSFADLVKEVEVLFKKSFGNDFITDASTPQGQLIGEMAKLIGKEEEKILKVLTMSNVDNLRGVDLDYQVAYKGLTRYPAKSATFKLSVVGKVAGNAVVLPTGTAMLRVRDGLRVMTLAEVHLSAGGTVEVMAKSVDVGDILVLKNDEFRLEQPNDDVTHVTCVMEAKGSIVESDEELLARYHSLRFQGDDRDVYIRNRLLEHAAHVRLVDNKTLSDLEGVPSGQVGIVAHGIDNEEEFAKLLFSLLDVATPTHGRVSKSVTDSQGIAQSVNYSLANEVEVCLNVRLRGKEGLVLNASTLEDYKQKIVEHYNKMENRIGRDVYLSDVMDLLKSDNFFVSEIKISKQGDANPQFVYQLSIANDEIGVFSVANITIVEGGA